MEQAAAELRWQELAEILLNAHVLQILTQNRKFLQLTAGRTEAGAAIHSAGGRQL